MTRSEMESKLEQLEWYAFYSENYWIPRGGSDYDGVTLCEAYVRATQPELKGQELFNKVMEYEYDLNKNNKLFIIGNTFKVKDELKELFNAKFNSDKKKWYVDSEFIKNKDFHEYCYDNSRRFHFRWESEND